MKVYREEIEAFEEFKKSNPWDPIAMSKEQYAAVINRGRPLLKWTTDHPYIHNAINIVLLVAMLAFDIGVLALVNHYYEAYPVLSLTLGILVHGFMAYSAIIFTIHEGAAHDRIIVSKGPMTRLLARLANNYNRIYFGDPVHYTEGHINHHKHYGTEQDGSFLNHIMPSRFWKSLLPGAAFLPFNDYKVHSGDEFTRSKILSSLLGLGFNVALVTLVLTKIPVWLGIAMLLVASYVSFTLDRLRESYEHNQLPDDNRISSRSMGLSFWGIVMGGGPWGQPCHYMHHIFPSLGWYAQLIMHYKVQDLYTAEQRKVIFENGFFSTPLQFLRMLRENQGRFDQVAQKKVASQRALPLAVVEKAAF